MSDQTITSLIEKLEGAEVGDRVLDAQIWCAVNGLIWKKPLVVSGFPDRFYSFRTNKGDIGLHGDDKRGFVEQYTTSLDAALALAERVVSDWRVAHLGASREADDHGAYIGGWSVRLHCMTKGVLHNLVYGEAATPALALCAAILRAQSEPRV